jgi:hypothetical protein
VTSDFVLSDDGNGGTFVRNSTPTPAVRFVETMAGMAGGRGAAETALLHSGGTVIAASPVMTASMSGR